MWLFLVLFIVSLVGGQEPVEKEPDADQKELKTIVISAKDRPLDQHSHETTEKTLILTKDRIQRNNYTSLNEAIDTMPGVDSQDYCLNCGAKRISINGLRGDHTSVLIDGIPLYSAVNSVYGFDAISMQSIEQIEVRRGTGSALLNPEAIGGSINLVTIDPEETSTRILGSIGTFNTQRVEMMQNYVTEDYKLSTGIEYNRQQPWDLDENGFSEAPWRSRTSGFIKQIFHLNDSTRWDVRVGHAELETIGGDVQHRRISQAVAIEATDLDFTDGDVRKPYIGDFEKIVESVKVKRTEVTSKLFKILDKKNTLEWNLAWAKYDQDSIYTHGYDYRTENFTTYTDIKWIHQLNSNQILHLGVSFREEFLRSESDVMYVSNGIPKDNFNFESYSIFAQHDWFLPYGLELSSALRMEHLQSDWNFLGEIEEQMVAPRFLLKWQHDDHWSQQLAYGRGYRMPLTSIESAHGAYDGFVVDITELETSHSAVYSLSYNTPEYYITPSVHYTHLNNMSYPLDPPVAHSGPLRFVNDTEDHDLFVYDTLVGFKPTPSWLLEMSYEVFRYPDAYKAKLPTAAIERRFGLRAEFDNKDYSFTLSGFWIGSRAIDKYYQYSDQYNVSDGVFGVSDPKWRRAPGYWLWNSSLTKKGKIFDWTVGVDNLLDFTQTGEGDSPAMWHLHGSHTHLDNRHVWGPNRGREYYIRAVAHF